MAAKLKAEGFNVTAMPETEEGAKACAHNANLIVTATPSRKPVLKGAWVTAGAHVNGKCLFTAIYTDTLCFVFTLTIGKNTNI